MTGNTERWKELAELASKEHDPETLTKLVAEINRLIDEKRALQKNAQVGKQDSEVA